ncbi:MAG: UDP-N-acetylmuramoyl-tripeptide--D-alanyl-D-alanine ligase [Deltaproteobacteria bacterium]|nr:UDP-N-acetylmuramoyl-tripeptide--D-alanyl-D-alanine ligase [Deltaproteobacteria bacterium]
MWTLKEITKILQGKAFHIKNPDISIEKISTDTRKISQHAAFIALKGENFDGHNFAKKAIADGAVVCIVEKKINEPCIVVASTLKALGVLAKYWRRRFDIPVIAVTGSNGKTSTKEWIFHVLSQKYNVLKTKGNFNNFVGLPLTLLKLDHHHEMCVVELGTNAPGEIKYLANIARPNIAIITNIGRAHLEGLHSLEDIAYEKVSLFHETLSYKGRCIINLDDPFLSSWHEKNKKNNLTISIINNKATFFASHIEEKEIGHINFDLFESGKNVGKFTLSLAGEHHIYPALFSIAIASHLKVDKKNIQKALSELKPYPGRFEVQPIGPHYIVDDTYNANPESMKVALLYLKKMKAQHNLKTVAILGDMLELGPQSKTYHEELGTLVGEALIDELYAIGLFSKFTVQIAQAPFKKHHSQHIDIIKDLMKRLDQPTLILVKGSRGMKMEQVVTNLKQQFKNVE